MLIVASTLIGISIFGLQIVNAGLLSAQGPTAERPQGGWHRDYYFFASTTDATYTATTTSATSTNKSLTFDSNGVPDDGSLNISGAKSVDLYLSRGDTTGQGNAGQSLFKFEVSPDGTNWFAFNRLLGDDIDQTPTSTVTIGAGTSTTHVKMDLQHSGFLKLRCIVVETTDGEHTCRAYAEY